MALDFPNSPTLNQTFTSPNGTIWMWDGVKWVAITSTSAYASSGNVGRNLIHNPLFNVAQRGAGPWTTGGYTVDRWIAVAGTDTIAYNRLIMADASRAAIGDEAAAYNVQNTFTGNAAAGAINYLAQPIEDVRRLAGKTVTVSFWATASSAALKLGINILQSFGTGGSPSAAAWSLATGASVTLSTAWARYTATIAIPSSAGKTTGTNNDSCSNLTFFFSSGATNNAVAGNISVQAGAVYLWGVQLEVGSVATPLEKPDPQLDWSNCFRFFRTWPNTIVVGYAAAAGTIYLYQTLSPPMRAAPTATPQTPSYFNASGLSVNAVSATDVRFSLTVTALGSGQCIFGTFLSADL